MSFGKRVTATKIELIKVRRSMQVAKMVHKILDDKREVLLKKIDEMIEEANNRWKRFTNQSMMHISH
jgi:V/A-type H+-transporting ATPase subunit D